MSKWIPVMVCMAVGCVEETPDDPWTKTFLADTDFSGHGFGCLAGEANVRGEVSPVAPIAMTATLTWTGRHPDIEETHDLEFEDMRTIGGSDDPAYCWLRSLGYVYATEDVVRNETSQFCAFDSFGEWTVLLVADLVDGRGICLAAGHDPALHAELGCSTR